MGINQSLAAEVARPLAAGGEILRQQVLAITRYLFGVACFALVAIAATVCAMYFASEQARFLATAIVLVELLLLLLVISNIRRRVVGQSVRRCPLAR